MKRPSRKLDPATVARAVELRRQGTTMRDIVIQLKAEGHTAARSSLGEAFKRPEIAAQLQAAAPAGRTAASGAAAVVAIADEDEELADGWIAVAEDGLDLLRIAFKGMRTAVEAGQASEKDIRLLLDGAERAAKVAAALQAREAPPEPDATPREDVVELTGELEARFRALLGDEKGDEKPISPPVAPPAKVGDEKGDEKIP